MSEMKPIPQQTQESENGLYHEIEQVEHEKCLKALWMLHLCGGITLFPSAAL